MEDGSKSEDLFSESSENDSGAEDSMQDSPSDRGHTNILAKRMPAYILRTSGSSDSEPEEQRSPPQRSATIASKRKGKTASDPPADNRTPSRRKECSTFPASKKTRIVQQFLNTKAKETSLRKVKLLAVAIRTGPYE